MKKVYPDRTFEFWSKHAGGNPRVLWEVKGPKDTGIAWLTCLAVGKGIAIVQTLKEGGWTIFTPTDSTDPATLISDALNRCGVKVKE